MIKSIAELTKKELKGKKVLLRVDFNVPVDNGKISEIYRFKSNLEVIDYLTERGAIVALLSHISAVKSFEPILDQIKKVLSFNFVFIPGSFLEKMEDKLADAKPSDIFFLDNVRQYDGEEKNDIKFAEKLANSFDIYVNNAFSVSHRSHASLTSVTNFLPSYAGQLLIKEIENLNKVLEIPLKNKTLIIAGAKVETKLPVIENFLDKADNILVGGVVANVFLKTRGMDIGKSMVDDNYLHHAKKILMIHPELRIPRDFIIRDEMILDIGPETISDFSGIIKTSKTVVWNGPLGKIEVPEATVGTRRIAEAIINSGAYSVVGGGDTIAFLEKINLIDKFDYISTGGGAMLEFLAGKELPGLRALGYGI